MFSHLRKQSILDFGFQTSDKSLKLGENPETSIFSAETRFCYNPPGMRWGLQIVLLCLMLSMHDVNINYTPVAGKKPPPPTFVYWIGPKFRKQNNTILSIFKDFQWRHVLASKIPHHQSLHLIMIDP